MRFFSSTPWIDDLLDAAFWSLLLVVVFHGDLEPVRYATRLAVSFVIFWLGNRLMTRFVRDDAGDVR